MANELKWLVVYVASRQEKKSSEKLRDKGIEVYLPIAKRLRQWSDRKKWVDFPMFPGYLFVRPALDQRDAVLHVPGILQYLRYNKEDAVVRDDEIQAIRNIEKSGYSVENLPSSGFEIGEMYEISEGPLHGQVVRLIQIKNKKEVVVILESIGQAVKIDIPGGLLQTIRK